LLRAFAYRSATKLLWQIGALRNLVLAGVVFGSLLLQLGLVHLEPTRALFGLAELSWADLMLVGLVSLIPVSVLESSKIVLQLAARLRRRGSHA
jgi:Ca2+-transporting ATPase